jgi:Mn-dependent DtxR family transcriptional regulator
MEESIEQLVKAGYLKKQGYRCRLTNKGLKVAMEILEEEGEEIPEGEDMYEYLIGVIMGDKT